MKFPILMFMPLLLLLLPGCTEIIRWEEEMPPIKKIPSPQVNITPYLKNIRAYDDFNPVLWADALYLSSEVRTAAVELYAERNGIGEKQKNSLLSPQYDELKQQITFYVLLPYTINITRNSSWSMRLRVDNKTYPTLSIKKVDLSPEYERFFGLRYTRFKVPYKVVFLPIDEEGRKILQGKNQTIALEFNNGVFFGEMLFPTEATE